MTMATPSHLCKYSRRVPAEVSTPQGGLFLRLPKTCLFLTVVVCATACSESNTAPTPTPTPATPAAPQLTAPALDTPTDDEQLSTLRPELTVRNGTSNQATGTRTYEFQIADNTGFSPV